MYNHFPSWDKDTSGSERLTNLPQDIQQVRKIRGPRQSEPTASPDGKESISRDHCECKSYGQFFLRKDGKFWNSLIKSRLTSIYTWITYFKKLLETTMAITTRQVSYMHPLKWSQPL